MIGTEQKKLDVASEAIMEANEQQLGEITLGVINRLGELGLQGREAIIDRINADRNPDTDEGLAQLADVISATE
jgi:hypothetical protein